MDRPEDTKPEEKAGGYERRDLGIRPILLSAGILVVATIGILLGLARLMHAFNARDSARQPSISPVARARQTPAEPRLEIGEKETLVQLRQKEDQLLTHYSWIDPTTDTVRIPISRAMELIAERGLPARTPAGEKE